MPEDLAGRRLDQAAARCARVFAKPVEDLDRRRSAHARRPQHAPPNATERRRGAGASDRPRDRRSRRAGGDSARARVSRRCAARDRQARRFGRASGRRQPVGDAAKRAAASRLRARGCAARGLDPSARQGHQRAAARGAQAREPKDALGGARAARDQPHLSRRLSRRVHGRRPGRRADRPPQRERTRWPSSTAAGARPLAIVCSSGSARTRTARSSSRPVERIRSACTWRTSERRSSAIPSMAGGPGSRAAERRVAAVLNAFRRQALHATSSRSPIRRRGAALSFESALPRDFERCSRALRADAAVSR